jgi:hypothetical protein
MTDQVVLDAHTVRQPGNDVFQTHILLSKTLSPDLTQIPGLVDDVGVVWDAALITDSHPKIQVEKDDSSPSGYLVHSDSPLTLVLDTQNISLTHTVQASAGVEVKAGNVLYSRLVCKSQSPDKAALSIKTGAKVSLGAKSEIEGLVAVDDGKFTAEKVEFTSDDFGIKGLPGSEIVLDKCNLKAKRVLRVRGAKLNATDCTFLKSSTDNFNNIVFSEGAIGEISGGTIEGSVSIEQSKLRIHGVSLVEQKDQKKPEFPVFIVEGDGSNEESGVLTLENTTIKGSVMIGKAGKISMDEASLFSSCTDVSEFLHGKGIVEVRRNDGTVWVYQLQGNDADYDGLAKMQTIAEAYLEEEMKLNQYDITKLHPLIEQILKEKDTPEKKELMAFLLGETIKNKGAAILNGIFSESSGFGNSHLWVKGEDLQPNDGYVFEMDLIVKQCLPGDQEKTYSDYARNPNCNRLAKHVWGKAPIPINKKISTNTGKVLMGIEELSQMFAYAYYLPVENDRPGSFIDIQMVVPKDTASHLDQAAIIDPYLPYRILHVLYPKSQQFGTRNIAYPIKMLPADRLGYLDRVANPTQQYSGRPGEIPNDFASGVVYPVPLPQAVGDKNYFPQGMSRYNYPAG